MAEDEIEAIKAVQRGDKEHFRLLVSRHKNLVFGLIMRLVRNHSTAEDLSQEVFVKAYQGIKSFRFEAEFSTWLRQITLNHLNSYFASKKYKQQHVTEVNDFEMSAGQPDLEEHAIFKQQARALLNCLAKLRDKFRNALILNSLEGLTYEQVATVESVPVGTVRSRVHTARLLLLNCMGERF